MVTVIYGGSDANVSLGRNVGELRAAFKSGFSIPDTAQAVLDGVDVSDSAVPQDGQKLVFSLPAGSKG